jgi:nucleotide-binding universal stress UspA family protein
MEPQRILVPLDFSEAAKHAARYAAGLAAHTGAELTIMHVLPPPQYDYAMTEPSAEQVREFSMRRAAAASEKLESALPLLVDGARVRCETVEGDPAGRIASAANSGWFDAVVMSTRGSLAPRRFMIGSVTSKVLHDAELPIFTSVHFESHPSPLAIRRMICAIDLGRQSRKVLC